MSWILGTGSRAGRRKFQALLIFTDLICIINTLPNACGRHEENITTDGAVSRGFFELHISSILYS